MKKNRIGTVLVTGLLIALCFFAFYVSARESERKRGLGEAFGDVVRELNNLSEAAKKRQPSQH